MGHIFGRFLLASLSHRNLLIQRTGYSRSVAGREHNGTTGCNEQIRPKFGVRLPLLISKPFVFATDIYILENLMKHNHDFTCCSTLA
jgi:hypothetical protein